MIYWPLTTQKGDHFKPTAFLHAAQSLPQLSRMLSQAAFNINERRAQLMCRGVMSKAPGGKTELTAPEMTRGFRTYTTSSCSDTYVIHKALSADGCTRLMLTKSVNVLTYQTFIHSISLWLAAADVFCVAVKYIGRYMSGCGLTLWALLVL